MSDADRDARVRALLLEALAEFPVPVPVIVSAIISQPLALDIALAAAAPGATLLVAPELRYPRPLALRQSVTLTSTNTMPVGRMTVDEPCPMFLQGIQVVGDDVTLRGLDVRHGSRTQTLVDVTGANVVVDRNRLLGDPLSGQKRGLAMNGRNGTYTRNHVDECWGPYPGDDCQAAYSQNTPGPLYIVDNFLCGGTESLMVGGGDPEDEAHCPADILIAGNTITKQRAWQGRPISVKNTLELKNARRVLIEHNIIEYSWGGHGQDGYLLMLTPRNQGGKAPWSTVEDVTVRFNAFAHGAAAFNLLGRDNVFPSGQLTRIKIHDNTVTDLDPALYAGSQRMIMVQRGPLDVQIVDNVFDGVNLTSQVYFDGAPMCEQLIVKGNTWPRTKYGVFGTGATVNQGWRKFVASGTLGPNTEV